MTTIHYTMHGGRHGRYKRVPGEAIEVFDPWSHRSLQFRSRSLHNLWLIRQSAPGVRRIDIDPPPLKATLDGAEQLVRPDLVVTGGDRQPVYEVLTTDAAEVSADRLTAMRWLERERGIRWRHTRAGDLEKHFALLENMTFARQALTLHHDRRFRGLSQWVMRAVAQANNKQPGISLGALRRALVLRSGADGALPLEAVLLRLRDREDLFFDLNQRISDETTIQLR